MILQDFQVKKIQSVLCVFETSKTFMTYDGVYVYADGVGGRKQVTLAIGFTEDSGSLRAVIKYYLNTEGVKNDALSKHLELIGTGVLWENDNFKNLLSELGKNDVNFQKAQDYIFANEYLKRGQEYNDRELGLKTALGLLIVQDSILHGSINIVRNTFSEMPPTKKGDEKRWIKAYCVARRKWWMYHKKNPHYFKVGESTTTKEGIEKERKANYRMNCFLDAIQRGNWDLSLPINANGEKI